MSLMTVIYDCLIYLNSQKNNYFNSRKYSYSSARVSDEMTSLRFVLLMRALITIYPKTQYKLFKLRSQPKSQCFQGKGCFPPLDKRSHSLWQPSDATMQLIAKFPFYIMKAKEAPTLCSWFYQQYAAIVGCAEVLILVVMRSWLADS